MLTTVVPRVGDTIKPTNAVYPKNCLAPIESLLKQGNLIIRELFSSVRARYLEAARINRLDPEHLSFFNINTKTDLGTTRKIARKDMNDDKR